MFLLKGHPVLNIFFHLLRVKLQRIESSLSNLRNAKHGDGHHQHVMDADLSIVQENFIFFPWGEVNLFSNIEFNRKDGGV